MTKKQSTELNALIHSVLKTNAFYIRKYTETGIDAKNLQIKNEKDFQKLPFTTKKELIADQEKFPPFGTNLTNRRAKYVTFISTSGTTSDKVFITPYSEADFR